MRLLVIISWTFPLFEHKRFPLFGLIGKTIEETEEKEWEAFIAQPEIQQGFSRLADKIRADIAAGKFEEGGFAVK